MTQPITDRLNTALGQPQTDAGPGGAAQTGNGLQIHQLQVVLEGYRLYYDLSVAEGECLAIQGRSGVGKSTLLHTLAGFIRPHSGSIHWQGADLLALPADRRPVSMLFQDHNLFEHLSVRANLKLGFEQPPSEACLNAAADALEVSDQLEKQPAELSGGQRQRIGLIRTLLRPEPLILLDEPFAELDPHTRKKAVLWTRETAEKAGKTLLLITHQNEDADQLADRVLQLQHPDA